MRAVLVGWLDVYSEDGTWADASSFEFEQRLQYSAGFVLAVDSFFVLVASSVDPHLATFFQGMVIPIGLIKTLDSVGPEIATDEPLNEISIEATKVLLNFFPKEPSS